MDDTVTVAKPSTADQKKGAALIERVFDRLQAVYPKLRAFKCEAQDGNWLFEIAGPNRIVDGQVVGKLSSQAKLPIGTNEAKVYGTFLGWCDVYKIKLGMKVKKANAEEEDEAA